MKKVFISTLFLFLAFASTTFAHTYLKTSNPSDGQIVDGSLNELILQFDSTIEPTSLLTLTSEDGKEIPVSISANNDTLIAKFSSPLEDGTYEVQYNIIGNDGHPMSGSYLFMVNNAETSKAVAEEADSEKGSSFNWFVIILGALVIIVILALVTKPNKRRRRF